MQQYTQRMVEELAESLKMKFEPGYTPGLKFMSHLWEPLRAHYRWVCGKGGSGRQSVSIPGSKPG
jgi:hypothetical protein